MSRNKSKKTGNETPSKVHHVHQLILEHHTDVEELLTELQNAFGSTGASSAAPIEDTLLSILNEGDSMDNDVKTAVVECICALRCDTDETVQIEMNNEQNLLLLANLISQADEPQSNSMYYIKLLNLVGNIHQMFPEVEPTKKLLNCLHSKLKSNMNFSSFYQTLKCLNHLLDSCQLQLNEEKHAVKFLTDTLEVLLTAGDQECQLAIVELILRLFDKSLCNKLPADCPMSRQMLQELFELDLGDFEVECRNFLIRYNSSIQPESKVHSIDCINAFAGRGNSAVFYNKPGDEGYDKFWVDFNPGSKRLSLFCDEILSQTTGENMWQTISFHKSDISYYSLCRNLIKGRQDFSILLNLTLKRQVSELITFGPPAQGFEFFFNFSLECFEKLELALEHTFGRSLRRNKVSTVTNVIMVDEDITKVISAEDSAIKAPSLSCRASIAPGPVPSRPKVSAPIEDIKIKNEKHLNDLEESRPMVFNESPVVNRTETSIECDSLTLNSTNDLKKSFNKQNTSQALVSPHIQSYEDIYNDSKLREIENQAPKAQSSKTAKSIPDEKNNKPTRPEVKPKTAAKSMPMVKTDNKHNESIVSISEKFNIPVIKTSPAFFNRTCSDNDTFSFNSVEVRDINKPTKVTEVKKSPEVKRKPEAKKKQIAAKKKPAAKPAPSAVKEVPKAKSRISAPVRFSSNQNSSMLLTPTTQQDAEPQKAEKKPEIKTQPKASANPASNSFSINKFNGKNPFLITPEVGKKSEEATTPVMNPNKPKYDLKTPEAGFVMPDWAKTPEPKRESFKQEPEKHKDEKQAETTTFSEDFKPKSVSSSFRKENKSKTDDKKAKKQSELPKSKLDKEKANFTVKNALESKKEPKEKSLLSSKTFGKKSSCFEVNSPAPVSIKCTQDIDDDAQSDDPILLSSQEATNQKDTKENVAPFIESAPSKPNSVKKTKHSQHQTFEMTQQSSQEPPCSPAPKISLREKHNKKHSDSQISKNSPDKFFTSLKKTRVYHNSTLSEDSEENLISSDSESENSFERHKKLSKTFTSKVKDLPKKETLPPKSSERSPKHSEENDDQSKNWDVVSSFAQFCNEITTSKQQKPKPKPLKTPKSSFVPHSPITPRVVKHKIKEQQRLSRKFEPLDSPLIMKANNNFEKNFKYIIKQTESIIESACTENEKLDAKMSVVESQIHDISNQLSKLKESYGHLKSRRDKNFRLIIDAMKSHKSSIVKFMKESKIAIEE